MIVRNGLKKLVSNGIRAGLSASLALNGARMALLGDPNYEHPFHWSPFIVIGSERSPW